LFGYFNLHYKFLNFKHYVLDRCTTFADEKRTAHTAILSLQEYKTAD
jgi:hypothetical protein